MLLLVNWFVVISAWWQHWDWMYQYKNCENNVFFSRKLSFTKKTLSLSGRVFFSKFMQILKIPFRGILFFSKVSQLITIFCMTSLKRCALKRCEILQCASSEMLQFSRKRQRKMGHTSENWVVNTKHSLGNYSQDWIF